MIYEIINLNFHFPGMDIVTQVVKDPAGYYRTTLPNYYETSSKGGVKRQLFIGREVAEGRIKFTADTGDFFVAEPDWSSVQYSSRLSRDINNVPLTFKDLQCATI